MVRQGYRALEQEEEKRASSNSRVRVIEPLPDSHEDRLGINRRPASLSRTRLFRDFHDRRKNVEKKQRSVSNGRSDFPPHRRAQEETVVTRRAVSSGRPGIYEREKEHQAKKEAKLQMVRKEMMKECTFTPKTVISSSSTSRTTATIGSTETKCALDDVYERLYRHVGHASPVKLRSRTASLSIQPSPNNSSMSRSGSACSSRIEELYQDGVRKIRSRRMTEDQERALREKRREQQEILECTFRPKTHWKGRVVTTKHAAAGLGRIGISPRDQSVRSPPPTRKKRITPPEEIVVASPSDIRDLSPQRNRAGTTDYHPMVSPLHDPSVYDDARSIDDSTLLPRMHIGSTVGTSTAASVSNLTQSDATEYGSI